MTFIYDICFIIYAILYAPSFIIRRRWRAGMLQRFGLYDADMFSGIDDKGAIWVHAVSMGEMNCCREFFAKLKREFPGRPLVVSTVTETGYATARSMIGEGDLLIYSPLDISFIVRRLIRMMNPALFVAVETEIWPNLIGQLYEEKVPVVVVNGRLSERSFKGYMLVRPFMSAILKKISLFAMRNDEDASRIVRMGAPRDLVRVTGNMKFDIGVESGGMSSPEKMEPFGKGKRIIVAGSTHPGEEGIVLAAFKKLAQDNADLRLIIAPRHIERSRELVRIIECNDLSPFLLSDIETGTANPRDARDVLILDRIGHLRSYYSVADIVFVGGSLVARGGHNFVEPAVFFKPMISGPYTHNFEDMAKIFSDQGGLVTVHSVEELEEAIRRLLQDDEARIGMGRRAGEALRMNAGASLRNTECVRETLGLGWRSMVDRSLPIMNRTDIPAALARPLLIIISIFYSAGESVLRLSYHYGLLKRRNAPIPVISVGNLTLGGTGKTPFALMVAQLLERSKKSPAVLIRGYGGDESFMLENRLQGTPVLTGRDRYKSALKARDKLQCECVVLDDGFQHHRLKRDLDIVLIDATNPFGNGLMFPAGILREPLSSLSRADIVVVTKVDKGADNLEYIEKRIHEANDRAPIIHSRYEIGGVEDLMTGERHSPSTLRGRRLSLLAGIANPAYFEWVVKNAGGAIAATAFFPDHHNYSAGELLGAESGAVECDAEAIITTEKDAVRIRRAKGFISRIPVWVLQVRPVITKNEGDFLAGLNSVFNR